MPKETRKKKNSRVKTSPDPSNRVDEELSETDEQNPTPEESTIDSSGKSSYHFVFLIACKLMFCFFYLEKKGRKWPFGGKCLLKGS